MSSVEKMSAGLEVAGAVLLTVAAFLVHVIVGFSVAGVACLLFGLALERASLPASAAAVAPADESVEAA